MNKLVYSLLAVGGLAINADAALVAGTEIGIDFGPTAPTNNFNQAAATAAYGSISAGSLIDTSNAVVTGVGFTYTGSLTAFSNNDANEGQAGQPTVFNSSNLTDWLGMAGEPDTGVMTLTFTGLDDSLTYDLILGAAFTTNLPDTFWQVDGQSATTDADVAGSSYVSFSGLSTDGSGNLVITGTGNRSKAGYPRDCRFAADCRSGALHHPARCPWVAGSSPSSPLVASAGTHSSS